jgi:PAS domain S-box-containing protein
MFLEIVGRDAKSLSDLTWFDITHPDDQEVTSRYHQRLQDGEIDNFMLEKRYLRPDGTPVWVIAKAVRVCAGKSDPYALALIEDITARRQAEDALRESERSKAVLFSHLPGLAYRCRPDREWTMEFVSEGCQALTGYPPESILFNRELSYNDLIAPEFREIIWSEWQKALKQGTNFRYEYQIITRDGKRKWVLELGQGIYVESRVQALEGIVIDITSQKDNEARILFISEHDPR